MGTESTAHFSWWLPIPMPSSAGSLMSVPGQNLQGVDTANMLFSLLRAQDLVASNHEPDSNSLYNVCRFIIVHIIISIIIILYIIR